MIVHIVTLRWNEESTEEQVALACEGLAALPGQVPTMRSFCFGPDLKIGSPQNAEFGIVATFDDVDGLRAYREHPAHVALSAEHIAPYMAANSSVQIEV